MPEPLAVTWLGHATVDLLAGRTRLLTDPLLRPRVAHLRRHGPPPPADLRVDAVLVSHLHHDHLDRPSLRRLPPSRLVVPRGSASLVTGLGHEVVEVGPGDTLPIGEVTVNVVHADHDGGRTLSRVHGPALGFVVTDAAERRVYFAGDTGRFEAMRALAPVDLALLPIWGWGPSLGAGHLDPQSAAEAAVDVGAAAVVPIHWGTYAPVSARRSPPPWLDRPAGEFADALRELAPSVTLHQLRPGATLHLS